MRGGQSATCELAAARLEAKSRDAGWPPAGWTLVDDVDVEQLARALVVVTIDAALYRRWLLSIRRLETWTAVPRAADGRAAAEAELDRRLQALVLR